LRQWLRFKNLAGVDPRQEVTPFEKHPPASTDGLQPAGAQRPVKRGLTQAAKKFRSLLFR
jgi:hypothetical protein